MRTEGDTVAIYGDNGTKYATYLYDAWGSHTTTQLVYETRILLW
jgi:hypothetical protein